MALALTRGSGEAPQIATRTLAEGYKASLQSPEVEAAASHQFALSSPASTQWLNRLLQPLILAPMYLTVNACAGICAGCTWLSHAGSR